MGDSNWTELLRRIVVGSVERVMKLWETLLALGVLSIILNLFSLGGFFALIILNYYSHE